MRVLCHSVVPLCVDQYSSVLSHPCVKKDGS